MKDNFWGRIWSSFREIQNFWYGFLGVVLAILFSVVSGKVTIPLYVLIIVVTVFILITSTLFNAYEKAYKEYLRVRHPEILQVTIDIRTQNIVCLIENSELFATNSMVSFYYKDENSFESLIAIGYVKNIQLDGKAQIVIERSYSTYQDILDGLKNNNPQIIERFFVRPGIPRDF